MACAQLVTPAVRSLPGGQPRCLTTWTSSALGRPAQVREETQCCAPETASPLGHGVACTGAHMPASVRAKHLNIWRHALKWQLPCQAQPQHSHACHPEKENVMASLHHCVASATTAYHQRRSHFTNCVARTASAKPNHAVVSVSTDCRICEKTYGASYHASGNTWRDRQSPLAIPAC